MIRVAVLHGYGFNCQEETAAGYQLAGAAPTVVYATDWFAGRTSLREFDLLHVPGGFTFGDDLGSGQVFANQLKHAKLPSGEPIWQQIVDLLRRGGHIVGVCNGFQILVRAGLLPNLSGQFAQEVSLAPNGSGKFEDRWVRCRPRGRGTAWFGDGVLELPVRHGEGRLVFGSAAIADEVDRRGLLALQYAGRSTRAGYPANPNGAQRDAAGLFSADGQVFGLMPHPEAFLSPYNHPAWPQRMRSGAAQPDGIADGLHMLQAIVARCEGELHG